MHHRDPECLARRGVEFGCDGLVARAADPGRLVTAHGSPPTRTITARSSPLVDLDGHVLEDAGAVDECPGAQPHGHRASRTRTGRTAPLTTYESLWGASAVSAMRTAVSSSPPTQVASDGARVLDIGEHVREEPFESEGATVAWRRE